MMKHRIVVLDFPYDNLSGSKIRPANCLTDPVGEHRQIIFALITSHIPAPLLFSPEWDDPVFVRKSNGASQDRIANAIVPP